MPDGMRSDAPTEARRGHRKLIAVLLATLAMALLIGLLSTRLMNSDGPAQAKLPQSIEEYRIALKQPDFGMFFVDFSQALATPGTNLTLANAKVHLYELLGRRQSNLGATTNRGNLVADYSAVVRKRISFGQSWLKMTNTISYDDSKPRTRHDTVSQIEDILRTNGGFIFHLNSTNDVLLTEEDLKALGQPIPRIHH
jgi:hypothetical protein